MKKQTKAIFQSLAVAALGVAIGFLGELMPDHFKAKIEALATQTFGISFTKCWLVAVGLVVLLFLFVVWREALQKDEPAAAAPPGSPPKVLQTGDKPVYIKKNEGPININ